MRCTIVLEFDDGDGSVMKRAELMRSHRLIEDPTPGDVGLSLAEGKLLLNCVQQEFAVEQIKRFCASGRSCLVCGVQRRLHDSHCSELKTALGKVFYCRERWKACNCGSDGSRYVSPLKHYVTEASTGELRWLHAQLGATMPYRQAKARHGSSDTHLRSRQSCNCPQPHCGHRKIDTARTARAPVVRDDKTRCGARH
jgi:hypothetical protein